MYLLSYIFLYLQLSIFFSIKFHLKILVTAAGATHLLCITAHENIRQECPKILITHFHTKLESQRHGGFENENYMSILPCRVTN